MAKRVFELAREIGVRSKDVLLKCRAEGLELKNHMATLSAGLQATIQEWFSEVDDESAAVHTAVETSEHVNLAEAREEARKTRRRRKPKLEPEPEPEEITPEAEQVAAEAPPELAVGEAGVAGEVAAEVPSGEQAVAIAEPPAVEAVAPAEVIEGEVPPEPSAEAPVAEEAPEPEPPPEEEPPEPKVQAVGPQVVPKPATLKGPRVIRVEQPDYVSIPSRRRPSAERPRAVRRPEGPAEPGEESTTSAPSRRGRERDAVGEDAATKRRRRSPRRRGGQATDSGEKLKEWRNRDLVERSERLAAASGGLRRRRPSPSGKQFTGGGGAKSGRVEIPEPITVKSFSAATGIRSAMVIKDLMTHGMLATINEVLSRETAEMIALEYEIELVVRRAKTAKEELLEQLAARPEGQKTPRAPVVTFLGHVDHGKTSLLDYIRKTKVAVGEAGGITQHTGAYRYDDGERHVVFLDTPGHEAFTAMRARGANMTDVVVLVVAADDGVMPQTIEAINHAKAAEVPVVVALNKIDVPNSNVDRALGQLAEHGLQPRQWGGEVEVIETSAITGQGVDTLVETLSLEAEILELQADPVATGRGYVIEAEMNSGLGAVAGLLVRDGTLRVGDVLLAGVGYGRIRRMVDSSGKEIAEAGPATPVEVSGLDAVPDAGDRFYVTEDIEQARAIAEERRRHDRAESLAGSRQLTLETLFEQIEAGEAHELPVIIKGDVQGTVEALADSLNKLSTEEVRVRILHSGVGGVSTGDVALAEASNAIIIGFNVASDAAARQLAERSGVDIRTYRVIYQIIDDVRRALEEGLAPEIREETIAHAEVRQTFKVSRVGTIAGCFVIDGTVVRNAEVRIIRDTLVIEDERSLDSLKRFKDDVREVRAGMECGLKIAGYDDIKEGDVLEFYRRVEVARTL